MVALRSEALRVRLPDERSIGLIIKYDRFHLECHRWRNCGNENMRKPSRSPQKAANLGGSERSRELFLEVPVKITTLTLYQTWYDITDQRSKTPQGRHLEASQNHPRFAAFRGDLEGFLIFQISTLPPPDTLKWNLSYTSMHKMIRFLLD